MLFKVESFDIFFKRNQFIKFCGKSNLLLNRIADLIKIKEMSRDLDEVKINFISNLSRKREREGGREWEWKVCSSFFKIENARDYISETTKFTMFS